MWLAEGRSTIVQHIRTDEWGHSGWQEQRRSLNAAQLFPGMKRHKERILWTLMAGATAHNQADAFIAQNLRQPTNLRHKPLQPRKTLHAQRLSGPYTSTTRAIIGECVSRGCRQSPPAACSARHLRSSPGMAEGNRYSAPMETPPTAAAGTARWSSSAAMSSAIAGNVSRDGSPIPDVRPCPRLS